MLKQILFLEEFKQSLTIYVACSGGIDSMVLLHELQNAELPVHVLHCNFQLRGADSDADETFLRAYCEQHRIPITVKRFDTLGFRQNQKQSIQEIARNLRYNWFDDILSKNHKALLCTAHHADDQEEQLWLRLLSSGRLMDMGGIPKQRGQIRRPLLHIRKESIAKYAELQRLQWREDASNSKTDYTRNKIRLSLIPLLQEIDPRHSIALQKLHSQADLLKQQSQTIIKNNFGNAPLRGEFFVESDFWENQLFIVKEVLLEQWYGSNAVLAEVERFFKYSKFGACLELKNEFYVLREKDGLWFGNNQLDTFEPLRISTKKDVENSRLWAFLSEILGQSNSGVFDSNLLCIKRIQAGDQILFLNGKKRSVKKIFNDRAWSFKTRRKALGVYSDDLIIEVIDRAALERLNPDENHIQT